MRSAIVRTILNSGLRFLTSEGTRRVRFCLAALWVSSSLFGLPVERLTFHSPTFDEPSYRIEFPFHVKGERVLVKNLELNGTEAKPFLVMKDGKNIAPSAPLEGGLYIFVIDYAWAGGKSYQARLTYRLEKAEMPKTVEISSVSPREGGIPGGKEGFYRVYQVEEETGIERSQEVIALTLTAPKAEIDPPEIIIYDGAQAVPFEIMESRDSVPPEAASSTHPITSTLKIVLPIDCRPYEKKTLLVLKGDRASAPTQGLTVSGEGLGKTISGSKLSIQLHPQSGQVNTIEAHQLGVKLFNKAGVIHWNPDVFVPGIAWDHSFDWNPPAVFEEKKGAFLYLNSRRGPLPRLKGVRLDVRYTIEAGAPYFLSETRLDFEESLGVIAVRNDEMVLFCKLFDSLFYRDKKGEIIKLPLKEKDEVPFGLVHVAPEDLGWVGLVNTQDGFGFFSLRLRSAHGNLEVPGEYLQKAGTYFYAPSDGNYVYWVRPFIYTWADYFTNSHFAYVPRGSFFYEKNAYVILRLSEDLPQTLDRLSNKLRNPLRVF